MTRKKSAAESETLNVHAPIEAVFKAFLDPLVLREWLGVELDLVPVLNGKYCVTGPDGERCDGAIEIIAWPEALSITWDDGRFDLSLAAGFGSTDVTLTTEGAPLWSGALARLGAYLQRPGRR